MIVDDRPVVRPTEADAPLHTDPNAVLTGTVAPQHFQPIARQRGQVTERLSTVKQDQTAHRLSGEALKGGDALTLKEASRLPVFAASDPAGRL